MSEINNIMALRGLTTTNGEVHELAKPPVSLIGQDGNAFAIMGACTKAAKNAGWSDEKINGIMDEMKSGDYNHLLQTAMKYFEVD